MFIYFKEIILQRHILYAKAYADLKQGVSNTFLKHIWWLLEPLLLVAIYTLLIHDVLGRGDSDYPSFVFCGLIIWLWLSRSITQGASVLLNMKSVLNQTKLPLYPLLTAPIAVNFVYFIVGLVLLILIRHEPSMAYWQLIPLMLIQFLFCLALINCLAILQSYLRDTKNILNFGLRAWMYLSPVIYSAEYVLSSPELNETIKQFYMYNPATVLLVNYQNILLYNQTVNWYPLGILALSSILVLELGSLFLKKYQNNLIKTLIA